MVRFVSDDPSKRDLSNKGGLKVIAGGLARCATSSLQHAFENELGYGPCMHMAYIAPHTHMLQLCHAALLETADKARRQKLLHAIFDGYASTADFPGMVFVDDLLEMYPDAVVILNQRDGAATWLRSITGTLKFFSSTPYLLACYWWPTDYWHWRVHQAVKECWNRRFGLAGEPDDAVRNPDGFFVLETYERHNQWVREAARANKTRILEWRPEEGWQPICAFLGRPVPSKPFPRLNDENTIKVLRAILVTRGLLTWAALVAALAVGYWAWARYVNA